ncbi:MAG: hypothetical protein V2A74_00960 [bacterium]
MGTSKVSTFQKALEVVEALPGEQQSDLVEVVRKRLAEQRRDEIAAAVRATRSEYRAGKVKKGSVADLMRELRS